MVPVSFEDKNMVLGQEASLPLGQTKGKSRLAHVKGYALFYFAEWLVYQDTNGYVSLFFSVGTNFLGGTKLILQHGPTNDMMQYEVANGKRFQHQFQNVRVIERQ